jgi:hypothetical protein
MVFRKTLFFIESLLLFQKILILKLDFLSKPR